MRCSDDTFTDIMYKLIKYDSRHHTMGRANYSTSVHNIFKDKKNAYVIIEIVARVCGRWILHLNTNMTKLLICLAEKYKEMKINVQPTREFSGYIAMLQVAQIEWEQIRQIIAPWIANNDIHPKHFYDHVNRAFELMEVQSSSFVSALYDDRLHSRFKFEIENVPYGERWMEATFTRFSFTNYCKIMNEEKKHTQPSNDTSKIILIPPINNAAQKSQPRQQSQQNIKPKDRVPKKFQKYTKKQRNDRRNKINDWSEQVVTKLKDKYAKIFVENEYCAAFHSKDLSCAMAGKPACKFGRNTQQRLHFCVCGELGHTMEECKKIWKS